MTEVKAQHEKTPERAGSTDSVAMPDRRVRVMHVVPSFSTGGAQRVAAHILRYLDPHRFETAAVSLWGRFDTDMERDLAGAGIPVTYLNKSRGPDPRVFGRLASSFVAFGPDVVHTHVGALRYAWPVMMWKEIPARVHTLHNVAEKEATRAVRPLHRLAFRTGVRPVAIAGEVRQSFLRTYGGADIPVIMNGIPVARYRRPETPRALWRRRLGIGQGALVVTCVARIEPQKNHALLLQAFGKAAAVFSEAVLLLAGFDTPHRRPLEALVERLGLSGRVRFLGERFDIPDLLHGTDVFALASDWEGNPLTVMEAMAAGRAVVCTAVGGVPELIRDGVDGRLVPAGDVGAFADALLDVLGDPVLRRALGEAAARHAVRAFGVETMAAAYGALYLDLLGIRFDAN